MFSSALKALGPARAGTGACSFRCRAVTGFHALTMQGCELGSIFEHGIIVGWGCVQNAPRALQQARWRVCAPWLVHDGLPIKSVSHTYRVTAVAGVMVMYYIIEA